MGYTKPGQGEHIPEHGRISQEWKGPMIAGTRTEWCVEVNMGT